MADPGSPGASPSVEQVISSQADAGATSSQDGASNTNVSARVGVAGANGSVDQVNGTSATAAAVTSGDGTQAAQANGAADQNAPSNVNSVGSGEQSRQRWCGHSGERRVGERVGRSGRGCCRECSAQRETTQSSPTNVNVSVRIASPGAAEGVNPDEHRFRPGRSRRSEHGIAAAGAEYRLIGWERRKRAGCRWQLLERDPDARSVRVCVPEQRLLGVVYTVDDLLRSCSGGFFVCCHRRPNEPDQRQHLRSGRQSRC